MTGDVISLAEAHWKRCSPPGRFAFTREGWERYKRSADALCAAIGRAEAALAGNLTSREREVIRLRLQAASIILGNPGPFARMLGSQGR